MANQFLTDTRVVSIESHEGAEMSEAAPYTPPEWPRHLFAADGRSQQFNSQEEADATGEHWYKTPQEAQQAQPQASQPRPPLPDDESEGSPGEDRPHTPRSRR